MIICFMVVIVVVFMIFVVVLFVGVVELLKEIKIVMEGVYVLWNFVNFDGKFDGFEIDFVNDFCVCIKVKCLIVVQNWDGFILLLKVGKFDVIMVVMFIMLKCMEIIDFMQFYVIDFISFVVVKSSDFGKLGFFKDKVKFDDEVVVQGVVDKLKLLFKGKVIGVQLGMQILVFLKKYFGDVVEICEYKMIEQYDFDLVVGCVDGIIVQQMMVIVIFVKLEFVDYMFVGFGFVGGIMGMGIGVGICKEDIVLKDVFNKVIDEVIVDGIVKCLLEKWFYVDVILVK